MMSFDDALQKLVSDWVSQGERHEDIIASLREYADELQAAIDDDDNQ